MILYQFVGFYSFESVANSEDKFIELGFGYDKISTSDYYSSQDLISNFAKLEVIESLPQIGFRWKLSNVFSLRINYKNYTKGLTSESIYERRASPFIKSSRRKDPIIDFDFIYYDRLRREVNILKSLTTATRLSLMEKGMFKTEDILNSIRKDESTLRQELTTLMSVIPEMNKNKMDGRGIFGINDIIEYVTGKYLGSGFAALNPYAKVKSKIHSQVLMMEGYCDAVDEKRITPYFFFGVGGALHKLDRGEYQDANFNFAKIDKVKKINMAYTAGVGIKSRIENILEIGFSAAYYNHGSIRTKSTFSIENYSLTQSKILKFYLHGFEFITGISFIF